MIRILESNLSNLIAYESIPMRYHRTSRLDTDALKYNQFLEIPTEEYFKDYDVNCDDRPSSLPFRFNVTNWRMFTAFDGERRVAGAIMAFNTQGVDMLEGRDDLAIVWDFRVLPDMQRRAVGRQLWNACVACARSSGARELKVETQDTNVAACRFYYAMGCRLHSVETEAYGPDLDEVKLVWRLPL